MVALENNRVLVSSAACHTTSEARERLRAIAFSHPFTQQIDIVFPSCPPLEEALSKLDAVYWTCQITLSAFLDFAQSHFDETASERRITAIGLSDTDGGDVWAIDPRGFLTLIVGKETYESLGIVGQALPWKDKRHLHVIRISLRKSPPEAERGKAWTTFGPKVADAIRRWDSTRGLWTVSYHCVTDGVFPSNTIQHSAAKEHRRWENRRIPELRLEMLRSAGGRHGADDAEDWEDTVSSLFEWVGLAALGSPRLSVNDRCDPYIAVYDAPDGSRIGDVTTLRWHGYLTSNLIENIFNTITSPDIVPPSFISVTAQSIGMSPVSYLPADINKIPPTRLPRADAVDTWSLVYVGEGTGSWWILADSVGQWDQRWG
ncbi:hypothetical protein PYCCODRAFT_1407031 [Trametes coccinea BRFM310]|uniref:Uncharacterized protein n=1 Tax=Trametes coccinea (strain BRFM310) TaxID=1353009 RepID=A0A1Y2IUL4_TRAC3|nr:hypothetical protein PYCCODRAFT_1407031 [Trametes coccinea BRFM310]